MNPFRKRTRSHAVTGLHLTPRVLTTVSVDHQRGRKPRLMAARCETLTGGGDLEKTLREVSPGRHSPVNLVLADGQYELLLVDAPRVEPSELRAAVRWKVRNLIDFHIDDAVIDVFEIPGQSNRPQGQAMMYAVAARSRELREYIDLIERSDLNLSVIDITEMALRNLAAQLEADVRGVAMLYLDENHGILTITRQGDLYLSRRLETGTSQLFDRPEASFDQIALEVQRSLDYYDSHYGQPPLAALSILPGFASHEALVESLSERLNFDVTGYRAEDVVTSEVELPNEYLAELLIALGGALRHEEVSL
ncbi:MULTISPECIES: type IV pilus biogenesis protein PilM [unclassified Wenzhouxiangella]|uniref:type IV pilus biogenesis protein PilM n=1 Tax=unclassified Wenzhouxiangella TaxID=2613841 RepID=UPI0011C082E3|nr:MULTISPECIES: pilus assembly protein PilM [unclassified Wenzhouxiangella]